MKMRTSSKLKYLVAIEVKICYKDNDDEITISSIFAFSQLKDFCFCGSNTVQIVRSVLQLELDDSVILDRALLRS